MKDSDLRKGNMKIERRAFLEAAGLAAAAAAVFRAPAVNGQRPLPKSEYDYVDWSWENWRNITKATHPRVTSEQTGKAELVDLLDAHGKRITTAQQWKSKRDEIK